ncbi:MAG: hypothetical protein ABSF24_09235 [Candidatus Bathyarchaeia archaeon]|jgi:hypothetical protein
MGMLNVRLDDELEQKLRLEVVRRFRGKKGALRQAVQEAIKLWLKTGEQ